MEIDSSSSPELIMATPEEIIIKRLENLGVPAENLEHRQPGLIVYVKNKKSQIGDLVSALLPTNEEAMDGIMDLQMDSPKSTGSSAIKDLFQESMMWLQWLMFEGEPRRALDHLANTGQRGVCGAVWGNNDLAYRCRTCEHDPTCAICVPCFQSGNHKDHDYSIIYTGGGCCDCGDVTAWKREGFCSKHKGVEQVQPLPEEFANSLGPVLDSLLSCWRKGLLFAERISEESPRINSHATEYKSITDELTSAVVEMLLGFCKDSESLLSFISGRVFSSEGLLDVLVRAEKFLISGDIVKKLHELLLKMLGEPQFKYEFAKVFLSYYPAVVNEAVKENNDKVFKKYPLLSTFSVQIFTVPTLTPRLVKEMNLLAMLLDCLGDILISCAGENGRLKILNNGNVKACRMSSEWCDADEEQLNMLRVILVLFEGISGLHINWRKSHLYPINGVNNMEELTRILGGEVGELPTCYLGMPLGAKSKSLNIWNSVIEKCEKKLSRWKSQYISLGGRVTLINSVLDALPTYMMSVFPIPVGVIERLDKIRRDFLWKGDQDKKVFHLVKWDNVLWRKKQGGLGVRNLKLQSKALKLKWLWRYSHTSQPYWGRMIKAKYGEMNKWMTKEVHTPYGVSLWRSIRALWPLLWNHSTIKVSNGHKTSFWEDKWLGNTSLKELFPVIHGLAVNQHKKVAEIWDNHGWNLQFRRNFNDWEINTLTELFRLLEEFKGTQEGADKLWWKEDSKGTYKVSTAYKFLNQSNQQVQLWPWKHIWNVKVPFKVACFTWLLAREAVLTQENLKKRKFSLCSRCYLCGEEGETVNHLFLHCRITMQLWRIFVNLRGIVWVMPNRITSLLHCWEEAGIGATDRDRWRIVPACIWWTIWKERNSRCFEDSSSDVQKIKLNCIKLFCFWCKQIYLEETESIIEILGSC